jgi:hypothetical protein
MTENNIKKIKDNVVFTYGRFNPPTIGHKMVIQKVIDQAKNKADPYVVVSHSQDNKKNPLFFDEKIQIISQMFPDNVKILHTTKNEPYIGTIIQKFYDSGYGNVTMMVGSDRVDDFNYLLSSFPDLKIISAGERDPDSNTNISGVSATKIRNAALAGKRNTVRSGINEAISNSELNKLIQTIQERMIKTKTVKRKRNAGGGLKKTRTARKAGKAKN